MIGSTHCSGTLRVKEFLIRNGHPFAYIDLDHDPDAQELLDRFNVKAWAFNTTSCANKRREI